MTGGVLQIILSLARFAMPALMRDATGSEWMFVGYALASVVSTAGLGCVVAAVFSNRAATQG